MTKTKAAQELLNRAWNDLEEMPDPRNMTVEELEALGFNKKPILKAIRESYLEKCGGSKKEVRLCTDLDDPLWPYRMGTNPFRNRVKN